ncbi:MAG: tripartite tricarboxylate transporter TctB family protein [Paracoccus sp. (in: a-proteobacteria)]|uniref:tripartite tricarboxylate transporter TctB family protein n=1 Tax=Paracoccus sp. TaxID=267 RepID=UPI0040588F23
MLATRRVGASVIQRFSSYLNAWAGASRRRAVPPPVPEKTMLVKRPPLFLYVTLAVSVGYFISAVGLGAPVSESGLTPSFFPILVGGAAIVFSSILILQKIRTEPKEPGARGPRNFTHLWVVLAIFIYIIAFKPAGYFISSGIFVFVLVVLFSSFEKLLQKAVISVAIVVIAYVMFQQLFGVRLPTLWG